MLYLILKDIIIKNYEEEKERKRQEALKEKKLYARIERLEKHRFAR